jgi:hypothetical protein
VGPGDAVKAAVVGLLARKTAQLLEERLAASSPGPYVGEDDRRHAIEADDRTRYDDAGES